MTNFSMSEYSAIDALRDEAIQILNNAKMCASPAEKSSFLKQVTEIVLHRKSELLQEFLSHILEFQIDSSVVIRKQVAEIIEEISSKFPQYGEVISPVLLTFLRDNSPAVAKHSLIAGTSLLKNFIEKAIFIRQSKNEVEKSFVQTWNALKEFKDQVFKIAMEYGNDGVRLHAIKYIEVIILLFTTDPSLPSQLPPSYSGKGVNIAWIVNSHPFLDFAYLSQEASKSLRLLLSLLRPPHISSLSSPVAIVLLTSLTSIAKHRPFLYGRILPSLLSLSPSCDALKGIQVASILHSLKRSLLSLLKFPHPNAVPWKDKLVSALREMKANDEVDSALRQLERIKKNIEREKEKNKAMKTENDVNKMDDSALSTIKKRPLTSSANEKPTSSSPSPSDSTSPTDQTMPSTKRQKTTIPPSSFSKTQTTSPNLKPYQPSPSSEPSSAKSTQVKGEKNINVNEIGELYGVNSKLSPLLKMVGMLAALVEKGPMASSSVELLINSLPPDMLADVVIAYMEHLPSSFSETSTSFPASTLDMSSDIKRDPRRDPRRMESKKVKPEPMEVDGNQTYFQTRTYSESGTKSKALFQLPLLPGNFQKPFPKANFQISNLHPSSFPSLPPSLSLFPSGESVEGKEEKVEQKEMDMDMEYGYDVKLNAKLESKSKKGEFFADLSKTNLVLFEEKTRKIFLENLFSRILKSEKELDDSARKNFLISLIAKMTINLDDDYALEFIQSHILSDHQKNHSFMGFELAMGILFHLYSNFEFSENSKFSDFVDVNSKENEKEKKNIKNLEKYTNFFFNIIIEIIENFSASERIQIQNFFSSAPFLPASVHFFLKKMCFLEWQSNANDAYSEKNEFVLNKIQNFVSNSEKITLALSIIWDLILKRPSVRKKCLEIVLNCCVHKQEEIRSKAIRLVCNKLFPLSYLANDIESFSKLKMNELLEYKIDELKSDSLLDLYDNIQVEKDKNKITVEIAQQYLSLFFVLSSKKHSLLDELFSIFGKTPVGVQQAMLKHIPQLMKAIGPKNKNLLQIISNPPVDSKELILKALKCITENTEIFPSELIQRVKKLSLNRPKEPEYLIPVLSLMSKEDVLPIFPRLLHLPSDKFKNAIARILQGSAHSEPALSPQQVLIVLHKMDLQKENIPLKRVMEACSDCLMQKSIFNQQVIAKALNQLVEQTPLPLLFMRTVLISIGNFPNLISYVVDLLSRLVTKQIWKFPKLWEGFLKCAQQTLPKSLPVLLQLPTGQLEDAISKSPPLVAPLREYATNPSVKNSIPSSSLVLLGIGNEGEKQETKNEAEGSANGEDSNTQTPS